MRQCLEVSRSSRHGLPLRQRLDGKAKKGFEVYGLVSLYLSLSHILSASLSLSISFSLPLFTLRAYQLKTTNLLMLFSHSMSLCTVLCIGLLNLFCACVVQGFGLRVLGQRKAAGFLADYKECCKPVSN